MGGADLLGQLRLRRDGDRGRGGLRCCEEEREHGVLYKRHTMQMSIREAFGAGLGAFEVVHDVPINGCTALAENLRRDPFQFLFRQRR